MAGRPRKPTNVLQLSGAFRKDPQRLAARANEPQPDGPIGEAPAYMNEDEARVWGEIIAECPTGVLTNADRGILAVTVSMRLHAEQGEPFVVDGVPTSVRIFDTKKIALLMRCYTELGMTPASRSKVSAKTTKVEEINEFAAV